MIWNRTCEWYDSVGVCSHLRRRWLHCHGWLTTPLNLSHQFPASVCYNTFPLVACWICICYLFYYHSMNTPTVVAWPWPWPWFSPYSTGHIGPHSNAIRVCQELPPLLPPRWTPSFVGLCWLCPSSSLLVDLVLSCILVPASTVLAMVCACGPYGRHVQASEVVFLCMLSMVCCPVLVLTSTLVILSFHEMPSILLCHLWYAASRLFVNGAVNGHTSAPSYTQQHAPKFFTCVIYSNCVAQMSILVATSILHWWLELATGPSLTHQKQLMFISDFNMCIFGKKNQLLMTYFGCLSIETI